VYGTSFLLEPFNQNVVPCDNISNILFSFLGYVKLVELVMVQIVGSVKDERCFFTLVFMKSKFWNRLITHLPLVVGMFAQQFYTLQNFPYANCIE
jgi:hypothetical protein